MSANRPVMPPKEIPFRRPGAKFDEEERKVVQGRDRVWRLMKTPSDRLSVRVVIEITGNIRRADLDRFTQTMGKTVSLEFEDGGGGN